jgi:hypothetical protein
VDEIFFTMLPCHHKICFVTPSTIDSVFALKIEALHC